MKKAALRLVQQISTGPCGRLTSSRSLPALGSSRVDAALRGNQDAAQSKSIQSSPLLRRSFSTASGGVDGKSDGGFQFESSFDELFDTSAPDLVYGKKERIPAPQSDVLKCGIPENMLRYKTTHYEKLLQAPFVHTCEHRVYLLVDLDLLPLDELGHEILKQVAGHIRYDLRKKELRLQCNYFPSRIENKRYLVDTLDKLILSCQRVAKDISKVEGEAA